MKQTDRPVTCDTPELLRVMLNTLQFSMPVERAFCVLGQWGKMGWPHSMQYGRKIMTPGVLWRPEYGTQTASR